VSDEDTTYVGSETIPASGYLQPKQYRITCLCRVCATEYSWVADHIPKKNLPCPSSACVTRRLEAADRRAARNFAKMIAEGRGPATIGDKPVVKAIDTTANIVMEDYGLTDLQTNLREGDVARPKLSPEKQRQADHYFDGKAVQERNGMTSRQTEMIKRRAIAGAYRGMAASPAMLSYGRPAGESPLRVARVEQLRDK
jgi:hypothetical protein